MTDTEYITRLCLGGPADGEYRSMQAGCDHMRAAELTSPIVMEYSAENSDLISDASGCRAHNYRLESSKRYGSVWVHEDYDGVIK